MVVLETFYSAKTGRGRRRVSRLCLRCGARADYWRSSLPRLVRRSPRSKRGANSRPAREAERGNFPPARSGSVGLPCGPSIVERL